MGGTVFGIPKTQTQIHAGVAIIRNYQDTMDAKGALAELVNCCKTSARVIALSHLLYRQILSMRLDGDCHGM
jgi:hypothetical protein